MTALHAPRSPAPFAPLSSPRSRGARPARASSSADAQPAAGPRKLKLQPAEVVRRAARTLDAIITDFNASALVEDGAAEVDGEEPGETHSNLLRASVAKHLDDLDEPFLTALNGYIGAAAGTPGSPGKAPAELVRLLVAVREAVLDAVAEQLPAELRLLELLTATRGEATRVALVRAAASGGRAGVPPCPAAEVENAAARMVESMEDVDQGVADPRLLVRCVLAREAARDAAGGGTGPRRPDDRAQRVVTGAFPPSSVPRHEAGLLKELITVRDPTVRRGLLRHALSSSLSFSNEVDAEQATRSGTRPSGYIPRPGAPPPPPLGARPTPAAATSAPPRPPSPPPTPPVRPGRLLDAIANLRADIAVAEGLQRGDSSAEALDPVAARVAEVRRDALCVLEDMAEWTE